MLVVFLVLWVLTNGNHTDRLLGALRIGNVSLVMVVVFLTGHASVLLQVGIQIYCLHVHVKGRADWAVICRWVVIYGSVLRTLANTLPCFQNSCITCIIGCLIGWAWSTDTVHRRKLLQTHLQVCQLNISLLRCLQKPRTNCLSVSNWLRISSDIWNAKVIDGKSCTLWWPKLVR